MSKETLETFVTPWKEYAQRWQKYYRPPGRPSKSAIAEYRRHLKTAKQGLKRKPRVLIFGATPELRDVAYEEKYEVTFIDLNLEMILAMTSIMKHKNPEEIAVCGNWCDLPFQNHYFDAALGDIVLSNVPGELQDTFLKETQRVLKPQGYFISKIEVVPKDFPFESYEAVLNKFKNVPLSFYPDRASMPLELMVYFHNLTFNHKKKLIDLSLVIKGLKKYFKKDRFAHPNKKLNALLNDMWQMWQPMNKTWSVSWEHEVEKQTKKYFKIINKKVLADCYFKCNDQSFPIWQMQVKKTKGN